MAIELFTGKPGAGKTNHAVQRAVEALAKGRPVYVCNMNGMDIPGAIPWDDPREWEQLPAGSLLIVDEAQKFWRATRSNDIPDDVQAMETHRHLGIDFLLTTQQPTYLLKHMRGLIMPHTHHTALTKGSSRTFTWSNRCVEDCESTGELALAQEGVYFLDKEAFKKYKSTELDTHHPKIPRKLIIVGVIACAVIALAFVVRAKIGGLGQKEVAEGAAPVVSASAEPSRPQPVVPEGERRMTLREYVNALRPRVGAAPWSAPIFDGRDAVAKPEVYCISSEAGLDANGVMQPASQSCKTEQGTSYELDHKTARQLARDGNMYNPYREPMEPQEVERGAGGTPAAMPPLGGAPVGAGSGEQQTGYGGFRGTSASSP